MQDEVNQDYSEQNEVDRMKKGAEQQVANLFLTMMTLLTS